MKTPAYIFSLDNWVHNPARRKNRFRCNHCQKIVQDHSNLIMERNRGVWHIECWHSTVNNPQSLAFAAKARENEYLNAKSITKNTSIYNGSN